VAGDAGPAGRRAAPRGTAA